MSDQPAASSGEVLEFPDPHKSGLVPQLLMMFRALIGSPVRNTLFMLGALLVAVIGLTAYGQIRLNSWNQPFYDALSHRYLAGFVRQLGVFGMITAGLLALNVGQRWLTETLKLKLREGLVEDLVHNWLQPMRGFRLASAGPIGVNPDQRMHEDARHLTELSADLGTGLLQAAILLGMFVGVLWRISSNFAFRIHGHSYAIPGYMVWAAIAYAGSASLLSYWVGKGLITRNADRYQRESDLRFSLVRVNEHLDAISLAHGEADEERRIRIELAAVLAATKRIVLGLTNLTWVTAGYGWFTLVAPILAAAPLYFAGALSFGGLMLAAGAFTQVQSSMRWFIDNFSVIADWRATLLRVASFRRATVEAEALHRAESQISFRAGDADVLIIENLQIASPTGATLLKEKNVRIEPGERVLIAGESGTGKTLLFRALAGLWPWGSGTVTRPKERSILYVPRTPYWPPGTLREALCYPLETAHFQQQDFERALTRLNLQRLIPMLDQAGRWENALSEDDSISLVFARALLHRCEWIVIDEIFDTADANIRALVRDILANDLQHSAVIHIGRPMPNDATFKRVVHLIKDPTVRPLPRKGPSQARESGRRREMRA
jgi:vitamin B12/bleomycin/antimicrobial peptide transport system ATP-binding/permease protein